LAGLASSVWIEKHFDARVAPPENESKFQQWIGEVQHYKSEFSEANQHVVQMDQATRARDVDRETGVNAESYNLEPNPQGGYNYRIWFPPGSF